MHRQKARCAGHGVDLPTIDRTVMELTKGKYLLTTDKARLDLPAIHHYLSNESYWARNIPFDTFRRSVENSLCFVILQQHQPVAFARVISDFATVAYLGDVFVLPGHRGRGLSKWLLENIMAYPDLQGLRRWILLTRDAHGLYRQFGWQSIASPELWMEKHTPNAYQGTVDG